jgi:molybdopterin synthase catalytic subunit/molybdopterin converting factor small subunit
MQSVRMVYFAAARDLAGCSDEELPFQGGGSDGGLDEASFKVWLAEQKPRLQPYLSRMRLAVNGEFADDSTRIGPGDEVTVLPPVAGGSGAVDAVLAEVRDSNLSVDEALAAVRHPGAGGLCVFLGVVRDNADGSDVSRLDYEAYTELANKEMQRILRELMGEIPGVRLAAIHRVGELSIGDTAVVVAASAPHRAEAFRACREALDRIKETVPVWKKEWAPDGSALWVNLEESE